MGAGCSSQTSNVSTETTNPIVKTSTSSTEIAVGECVTTTVKLIGYRLSTAGGNAVSGSGSSITYTNGISQVSYEQLPGIDTSEIGDKVKLCLVSLPKNCPPGDSRGKFYSANNLRTNLSWTAYDSEHLCGGA
jgi:hypothetical protein